MKRYGQGHQPSVGYGATFVCAGIRRGIAPNPVPMVGIGKHIGSATSRTEADAQRDNIESPVVKALFDASERLA